MKKLLSVLAAATMLCSSSSLCAAPVSALEASTYYEYIELKDADVFPDPEAEYTEVTDNSLVFRVYDGYAVLAECTDRTITKIVIPEEIEGVPVVGVTGYPFGFCRNLTGITLPDTFRYINWSALVTTTIQNLNSSSVGVHNGVITMKNASESDEPIPSVREVIISENNPYYTVSEGLVYTKDMKSLVGCPPAMEITELSIPEQTERIGDYAFQGCHNLENAVIPPNIKHINNGAFVGCISLKSVDLPESITSLSGDVFGFCQALSEVAFNGALEIIGYGAFYNCTSLAEFTIPETVAYIGTNAFENAPCIVNENGIHYVGSWAVDSDENITQAVIREGTVGIAEMAFMLRSDVTYFEVPESVKYTGAIMFASSGAPSEIHYYGSAIGDKAISAAKSAQNVYIFDPNCDIFDSETTIPAQYSYTVEIESEDLLTRSEKISGDVVIYGYENSTAQAYAEKYNRPFVTLEKNTLQGDVNSDGEFNTADAVMLQKYILGNGTLTDWQTGDFCKDDVIDGYDLILMRKALLG